MNWQPRLLLRPNSGGSKVPTQSRSGNWPTVKRRRDSIDTRTGLGTSAFEAYRGRRRWIYFERGAWCRPGTVRCH